MADARLTHSVRGTLPFYTRQHHERDTSAVASIAAELGVDRDPLVHTETREGEIPIRGLATGRYVAVEDGSTSDWRQALANYADRLESHVDEFQGTAGYTLEDDRLDTTHDGLLESVEWSFSPGQPDEFEYDATFLVGRPTMEAETITQRSPTFDAGMDVWATVDGNGLPGMRDYRMTRSVGVSPSAVFNRETAENNDLVMEEGVTQRFVFEGTHFGTLTERRSADAALDALVATADPITLVTKFPGYSVDGFVTGYKSDQREAMGGNSHNYRLEFTIGQRS